MVYLLLLALVMSLLHWLGYLVCMILTKTLTLFWLLGVQAGGRHFSKWLRIKAGRFCSMFARRGSHDAALYWIRQSTTLVADARVARIFLISLSSTSAMDWTDWPLTTLLTAMENTNAPTKIWLIILLQLVK